MDGGATDGAAAADSATDNTDAEGPWWESVDAGTPSQVNDSDGDGVPDEVEYFACPGHTGACANDARDPEASPRRRGGFYFFEPPGEAPSPTRDTLDFGTAILKADVYFLVDTTGSMGEEIANLRTNLPRLIGQVQDRIPDVQFGLGHYGDYPFAECATIPPISPGAPPLEVCNIDVGLPYEHLVDIAAVPPGATMSALHTGVNALVAPDFAGGDQAESAVPAMWATLTGRALSWPPLPVPFMTRPPSGGVTLPGGSTTTRTTPCSAGRWGRPCFRPDAATILIDVTDAPSHNGPEPSFDYGVPGRPSYAETLGQLVRDDRNTFVVGIDTSGVDAARPDLEALARATRAVVGGRPLVYSTASNGTGLSDQIAAGIAAISGIPLDVSVEYEEDGTGTTRSDFVQSIVANVDGVPGRCAPHARASDTDGDGHADTFLGVPAGQRVCFDITPKMNETVPATEGPQIFRATLRVIGTLGGLRMLLDSREIFFLVPPSSPFVIPG